MSDTQMNEQPKSEPDEPTPLEKATAFKEAYIRYAAVAQVEADLDRLFAYGQIGAKIGTSANTYMLIGESGSGKTAALRRFERKHPMVREFERDVHPVLYVEVPSRTTRKALAEQILTALGAVVPAHSTEVKLTARAVYHLGKQKVKVLVLDEAQHVVIYEKKRLNYEAADWIKGIVNSGVCAVVLAGVPAVWEAYLYNGQLRRRSFGNRRLQAFRVSRPDEWLHFRGLLKYYGGELPLPKGSALEDELVALRIHRQVGGLIGCLSDFLSLALVLALEEELPSLTNHVLWEAANQLPDLADPNWENPFDMDRDKLIALALDAEEQRVVLGVDRPTGLRRGKRSLRQKDVLP